MDVKERLTNTKSLIDLMDNRFKVLGLKFGLDPVIGLIPVLGDILPMAVSFYLIKLAISAKAPKKLILKMAFITGADFLIGSVPILGDAIDFVFKAHDRNYTLLENYLDKV